MPLHPRDPLSNPNNFLIALLIALPAGVMLNVALDALWALPIAWLWDRTLVPLVHAPVIGYWRTVGLLLLASFVGSAVRGVRITLNK